MPHDLIDIINDAPRKHSYRTREGVIQSVGPTLATVQRVGSFTPIQCEYDPSMGVAVGKRCVVDWIPGRRFVIISVYNPPNTISPDDQPVGALELAPPFNVTASASLLGCILITWEVPVRLSVSFEVQRNSSAVDAGAVTIGSTRGNSFVDTGGTAAYFRVRSLTNEFRTSGWSAWVHGTVGTFSATDIESIEDTIASVLVEGTAIDIVYDDTANTITISVSGLTPADIGGFNEAVQDLMGADIIGGSKITSTYDDGAGTITIDFDGINVEDLLNAQITSLVDGDILTWVVSAGKWENKPAPAGFASPMTTEGDLIYQHTGVAARLPIGAAGKFMSSDGTDPLWADLPQAGILVTTDTAVVGNVGGGEDTLTTYTLPANTLATNGDVLHGLVGVQYAGNANTKRLRAYFGSTLIFDSLALAISSASDGVLEYWIYRLSSSTQLVLAKFDLSFSTGFVKPQITSASENLASTIVIKATGEATSTNDITQVSFHLEDITQSSGFGGGGGGGTGTALVSDKKSYTGGDFTRSGALANANSSLDITLTTGARRVLVGWILNSGNPNGADSLVDVEIDGVLQGEPLGLIFAGGDANNRNLSGSYLTGVLGAGSHTFKLMVGTDAGTATFYASHTYGRIDFWVEEQADAQGGSGGSSGPVLIYDNTLGSDGVWTVTNADLLAGTFADYVNISGEVTRLRTDNAYGGAGDNIALYVGNGSVDSTNTNYRRIRALSTLTSTTTGEADQPLINSVPDDGAPAGLYSNVQFTLFDINSTDDKLMSATSQGRLAATQMLQETNTAQWENTAVVDRLKLQVLSSGNFRLGARLRLYGKA